MSAPHNVFDRLQYAPRAHNASYQWRIPCIDDTKVGNACLMMKGNWVAWSGLNGPNCQVYFVDSKHSNTALDNLPKLTGRFNYGELESGEIKLACMDDENVASSSIMKFSSIEVGNIIPIKRREEFIGFFNFEKTTKKVYFDYHRCITFKNCHWQFKNGLLCKGDIYCQVRRTLVNSVGINSSFGHFYHCPLGLKLLDIMLCLTNENATNELNDGTMQFDFTKCDVENNDCICPIKYKIERNVQLKQCSLYNIYGSRCYEGCFNDNFKWTIGSEYNPRVRNDLNLGNNNDEWMHRMQILMPYIKSKEKNRVKLTLEFDCNNLNACDHIEKHGNRYRQSVINDNDDDHTGDTIQCFFQQKDNGELQENNDCLLQCYQFLPNNVDKLIEYLKKTNTIAMNISKDKIKTAIIRLVANPILGGTRVQNFNITMTGDCTIEYCIQLKRNNKKFEGILYKGIVRHHTVSVLPFINKIKFGKCDKQLSHVYKEIENLKELGIKFNHFDIPLTTMCRIIGYIGDSKYCKLLSHATDIKLPDTCPISCFANSTIYEYRFTYDISGYEKGNEKRDKQLKIKEKESKIWEPIFQSKSIDLIEYALNTRYDIRACYNDIDSCANICDSQGWNILHYGAFLNEPKLIEIGQTYFNKINITFKIKSRKHKSIEKLANCVNNLYLTGDNFGSLPIHIACQYGNADSLEQLLRAHRFEYLANDNRKQLLRRNDDGWTALGLALKHNQLECVKILVNCNIVHINWLDQKFNGWNALTLLGYSEAWSTLKWLLKQMDANDVRALKVAVDEFGTMLNDYFVDKSKDNDCQDQDQKELEW